MARLQVESKAVDPSIVERLQEEGENLKKEI